LKLLGDRLIQIVHFHHRSSGELAVRNPKGNIPCGSTPELLALPAKR
jgi:hypothetical protein